MRRITINCNRVLAKLLEKLRNYHPTRHHEIVCTMSMADFLSAIISLTPSSLGSLAPRGAT